MTQATTPIHPSAEELDLLFDGYSVLEILSSNQYGTSYRARQESLDRLVTIKILPPDLSETSERRTTFETICKEMAKLRHPNLVDVFDFGTQKDFLYLITEEVSGRSLREMIDGKFLSPAEATQLLHGICQGLHCAHQAGIVHQQLNPEHILIDDEGDAKIIHFGNAALTNDPSDSYPGLYQDLPIEGEADTSDDIYALGVIYYELLTGSVPFQPYLPPSEIQKVPTELDAIIARAIKLNANQRYDSVGKMADDLEAAAKQLQSKSSKTGSNLLNPAPGVASRPLRPTVLPSASANNSAAPVVTVVLVCAIALIVIIAIASSGNSDSKNQQSTSPSTAAQAAATPKQPQPRPARPKHKPNNQTGNDDWHTPVASHPGNDNSPSGETKPIKAPSPDPETEIPEVAEQEQPEPVEKKATAPTPPPFDIDEFLEKARAFVKTKGANQWIDYEKDLQKNIDRFERNIKRGVRKLNRDKRKPTEPLVAEAFASFRLQGRIPEKVNLVDKKPLKDLKSDHLNALADQKSIDDKYLLFFTHLGSLYTEGINKRIGQLKQEGNDQYAIMLQEEIDLTRDDPSRILRIVKGLSPDLDPDEEKDED